MYSIYDYIGETVRRCMFMIKGTDKKYRHLFSIVEHVEKRMQDFEAFPQNKINKYIDFDHNADGSKDKVFIAVDHVMLTEEMLKEPWNNFKVGDDEIISCGSGYEWKNHDPYTIEVIPAEGRSGKSELESLLPHRNCSSFVNYCKPTEWDDGFQDVLKSSRIKAQIKELSEKNLGYDLSQHENFYGAYIFVAYNPIFNALGLREGSDGKSIYCRVNYKEGRHDKLKFEILGKDNADSVIFKNEYYTNEVAFLYFFPLETSFHHLDVTVYDKDAVILDYYQYVTFIHSISYSFGIKDKELIIKEGNGSSHVVEKFVSDGIPMVIGKKIPLHSIWDTSDEFAYRKLEQNLDFIFFDGGKDENVQKNNISKAKNSVLRILNSVRGTDICYICDPYFDSTAFQNYIWETKSLSMQISIISSKQGLKNREELKGLIDQYNHEIGGHVQCRLLRGEDSLLHDRFIIAGDKVWMLGCSLNMLGKRATTLIRVPNAYCKKMITTAQEWWDDDKTTEELQ